MKKIFKEWGGTIIVVIAIVALIGLVTLLMQPGGLMEGAFGNISQAFVNKSNSLIANAGDISSTIPDTGDTSSTIPDGGTYTTAGGEVLTAGSNFPATVSVGDKYEYGDYVYTYTNMIYSYGYSTYSEGWEVEINTAVTDKNQTTYGPILESVNGAPVKALTNTFDGCTSLTTAPVIPINVTSLFNTFRDCTALTTAPAIPSSVDDMIATFFGCASLKTYVGSTDPDGDFSGYIIPNGVIDMSSTFEGCTSLTTAPAIPSNVTDMGNTFFACTSLTTAPVIPSSVTNMSQTFANCTSLKTYAGSTDPDGDFSGYIIPNGVTNVSAAFCQTLLTTAPVIPSSVTNMSSTFNGCTSLTTAPVIPSSVTNVSRLFYDCTSLKTYAGCTDPDGDFSGYIIPNGVQYLTHTFKGCAALTGTIIIPCTCDSSFASYSNFSIKHYEGCGH